MPALRYSALTHDEVGLLLAPGAMTPPLRS